MQTCDETAPVAYMEEHEVDGLMDLFVGEDFVVTSSPKTGLVMVSALDAFSTSFHIGEMLVTEAAVSYLGTEGYGMVGGDSPERALARAAADAVLRAGNGGALREAVSARLAEARERRSEALKEEAAAVATTRVSFDRVAGE